MTQTATRILPCCASWTARSRSSPANLQKHAKMLVDTPVATMGIRGTAIHAEVARITVGPTKVSILREPGGHVGGFDIIDKLTGLPVKTVNKLGSITYISSAGINQPITLFEGL